MASVRAVSRAAAGMPLTVALGITNYADYKVHFALYSAKEGHADYPLETFLKCYSRGRFQNWETWNNCAPIGWGNHFNRRYILSLARISKNNDQWLFCRVFEVLCRWQAPPIVGGGRKLYWHYRITWHSNITGSMEEGRIVLRFPFNGGIVRRNLENCYSDLLLDSPPLSRVYQGGTIP